MLKLYGFARSRASRVLWMLHEIGLPYEHIPINVGPTGTADPGFLALNPNGRVPVIDDDGLVLWESLAINLYLAKRHGGELGPRDMAEDGLMTMWSVWAVAHFQPDAHEVLLQTINLPPEKRNPQSLADAIDRLTRPLGALEQALTRGGGFLVGGRFTVADLNVATVAFYLRGKTDALARFPEVQSWYGAAADRPAFKTMLALRERG